MSESFANDAATGSAQFDTSADPPRDAKAGPTTLTVAYDAPSKSYTIMTQGRSQTFGPQDIDASQGSAGATVYKKVQGATTESLTLTKPGTSGPLTYQYVGAGFWQRSTTQGSTIDGSFDAFTYGVVTPDANLPRTGVGSYSVDLLGVMSDGVPESLTGTGSLSADFASGLVSTSGTYQKVMSDGSVVPVTYSFAGSGQLGSGNSFSGTFGLSDFGTYAGNMDGRFYGPQAQEVGAVWYASGTNGQVATGTLTGRSGGAAGSNLTLTNLAVDQTFVAPTSEIGYNLSPSGQLNSADTGGMSGTNLAFKAGGTFIYSDFFDGDIVFGPETKNSAASNARFTVYDTTGANGVKYRLTLYNPGSGNDELALTYVSFGRWQRTQGPDINGGFGTRDISFVWGLRTDPTLLPRVGAGHYTGVLYGTAADLDAGGDLYSLTGTSRFDVDFQHLTLTGSLSPIGTDTVTGAKHDFGTYQFSFGTVSPTDATIGAYIVDSSNNQLGTFAGSLYGPKASEIGGVFRFQSAFSSPSAPASQLFMLSGATVAKDPSR